MSQPSLARRAAQVKPARKHAGDRAHLSVMPLVAYLLTASHLGHSPDCIGDATNGIGDGTARLDGADQPNR
jgi:hypothetical protein